MTAAKELPESSVTTTPRRPTPRREGFSPLQWGLLMIFMLYCLLPLWWVITTMNKDNGQLFSTFGLWFASPSHLIDNFHTLFTRQDGIFSRWLLNSVIYAVATAAGSMLVSAMGGYAFSKFSFRGRDPIFNLILATIMVPSTALALPIFLLMQKIGLINTYWAVILPGLVNPFGLYLMRLFWDAGFPTELMEAARIDGASEGTIFSRLGLPLVRGGLVTVALFSFVGAWNNFFLPLVVVNRDTLFPLTLGLSVWNQTSSSSGQEPIYTVIVLGALISILPLIIAFLSLGRYWQGGLASGAVKG
ncbi:carbohydrate ABC transporter permease [Deinococcus detaillensis]|uniref:Carbohydrate ABC transporter permease n=1 Tax=Deinococcus detaillensis TaxID=2592048 RepID=A0A553V4Q7_9DEIO|nr:carbohydrate ABC transporter permease [Deinococcus detaillensis]TSA87457.1 carbohydrate ABC transporter permease [Deinococcus detaillensis]